jgi:MarR family 2-MHQ and catechol resistance regulon transcriptional repressor
MRRTFHCNGFEEPADMAQRRAKAVPGGAAIGEGAWRELLRVFGLIERIMHPYFARFGISGSQWGVLRTLHRAEQEGQDRLRLTDLAARLLIRSPSISGVVDRMERLGLVRREDDPADLRAKQVVLTVEGRELLDRVLVNHQAQIDKLMSGLNRAEQAQLNALLVKLGRHLNGLLA